MSFSFKSLTGWRLRNSSKDWTRVVIIIISLIIIVVVVEQLLVSNLEAESEILNVRGPLLNNDITFIDRKRLVVDLDNVLWVCLAHKVEEAVIQSSHTKRSLALFTPAQIHSTMRFEQYDLDPNNQMTWLLSKSKSQTMMIEVPMGIPL